MSDTIKLGFSTCPNDTFMLAGLVNGYIPMEGIIIEPQLADIEELNNLASEGALDVVKMSVNAYPISSINYQMLRVGAAIGYENGPLLVCKPGNEEVVNNPNVRVAIPGLHTTANLLLTTFYPEITEKTVVLFSDIENQVMKGEFDAGVIIHESRFSYKDKGLSLIADFGEKWKEQNDTALPLGCFAVKRRLQLDYKKAIEEAIRKSIIFGYENLETVMPFVKQHAQSMSEEVILKHIRTYVNHYSVSLGIEGISAMRAVFRKAKHANMYNLLTEPIFID